MRAKVNESESQRERKSANESHVRVNESQAKLSEHLRYQAEHGNERKLGYG